MSFVVASAIAGVFLGITLAIVVLAGHAGEARTSLSMNSAGDYYVVSVLAAVFLLRFFFDPVHQLASRIFSGRIGLSTYASSRLWLESRMAAHLGETLAVALVLLAQTLPLLSWLLFASSLLTTIASITLPSRLRQVRDSSAGDVRRLELATLSEWPPILGWTLLSLALFSFSILVAWVSVPDFGLSGITTAVVLLKTVPTILLPIVMKIRNARVGVGKKSGPHLRLEVLHSSQGASAAIVLVPGANRLCLGAKPQEISEVLSRNFPHCDVLVSRSGIAELERTRESLACGIARQRRLVAELSRKYPSLYLLGFSIGGFESLFLSLTGKTKGTLSFSAPVRLSEFRQDFQPGDYGDLTKVDSFPCRTVLVSELGHTRIPAHDYRQQEFLANKKGVTIERVERLNRRFLTQGSGLVSLVSVLIFDKTVANGGDQH